MCSLANNTRVEDGKCGTQEESEFKSGLAEFQKMRFWSHLCEIDGCSPGNAEVLQAGRGGEHRQGGVPGQAGLSSSKAETPEVSEMSGPVSGANPFCHTMLPLLKIWVKLGAFVWHD